MLFYRAPPLGELRVAVRGITRKHYNFLAHRVLITLHPISCILAQPRCALARSALECFALPSAPRPSAVGTLAQLRCALIPLHPISCILTLPLPNKPRQPAVLRGC